MSKDIDYFFKPKSIAVIGASRNPRKFGHVIFRNLLGKNAYPVNPNASEILGRKAYASVKELPKIDLAVITVPAAAAVEVLKDCREKGVKAAIIVTAGFAESGNVQGEEDIKRYRGQMRVIGPNVIGVYDSYSGVDTVFNLRHRQQRPRKGFISFVSQSGAFGAAAMDLAADEHVGISKFVSLGNMVDVDEAEMINYLASDASTKVVCMYLEGSKNYRGLFKVLSFCSKRKPVIVMKAGRTDVAKKAVASHTASMAGSARIFSGMLKQAGALEVETSEDMFAAAKAFSQPLPNGNRVQIVTDGGGFGILAADALLAAGMRLSKLSPQALKSVRSVVPDYASISNPLDLTGDADTKRYRDVLAPVLGDKNVDAVIVILLMQISSLDSKIVDVLTSMKHFKKPLLACMPGGQYTSLHRRLLEEKGIPTYRSPEQAVVSMRCLYDYERISRR